MKLFLTIRLNSIIFISMMLQICVTPGFSQWKIVEGYSICYEFSPIVVRVSGNTEKVSLRGVSFDKLRTSFTEVCFSGSQSPVVSMEIISSRNPVLSFY